MWSATGSLVSCINMSFLYQTDEVIRLSYRFGLNYSVKICQGLVAG